MLTKIITLTLCLIISTSCFAGNIVLDADDRVEYHQKEQKLIAKGNATASKENLLIKADSLTGYYDKTGKNKISRIEADNNVTIKTPDASAFGDKMTYDVKEDTIILTGSPATIKNIDFTIRSTGPITFYQSKQKAMANEGVEAIDNKNNHISANNMIAWFTKDSNDNLILDKIDISENVKITSKDTIVTARKGTYLAIDSKIYLYDDVTINQNGNILKGAKAETDLNTSISKILSESKTGRVKGIFKEKKKKE